MGQVRSKTTKKKIPRRRASEDLREATLGDNEENLPPNPITANISGRYYVLRDAHWVQEAHNDMRPLEREPKSNKTSDILARENTSLRLKISRLLDMIFHLHSSSVVSLLWKLLLFPVSYLLQISQDIGRLSLLDKRIDSLNSPQESKLATVRMQAENDQATNRQLGLPPPSATLPFKISDPERIRRRLEGVVFGVGQPLLDVVAKVTVEFLNSFNLPNEEVHELGDNEMGLVSLLFEVFPVEYLTGGSAQNCLIMSQWLFAVPKATTFAGCIGKDNIGDILTKTLTEAGINIILRVQESHETGLCIVFESAHGRRIALRVGAIRNSIRTAFDQPQHRAMFRKARCFYAEAYTLTYALEAALELGRYAAANDRYFCLNLSATHSSLRPAQGVAELLPYTDVLFAGETDAQAYAVMLGLSSAADELDANVLGLSGWRKENGLKGRIVVVVRPTRDTVVVREGQLATFPATRPGPGNVVDDIGFGDAFAGAFMAILVLGGSVDECLEAGVRAATFSLFERGCAPPKPIASGARKLSRRESLSV